MADRFALVQATGDVAGHQTGGVEIDMGVGRHGLDQLMVDQRGPEGLAPRHVGLGDFHRAAGQAGAAHAVEEARAFEAQLGVVEALAGLADQGVGSHAAAVEPNLAVAAVREAVHRTDVANQFPARIGGVDQEPAHPFGGARDHDREGRVDGTRREPLVPIEHPAVAVAACRGADHAGVRAHARRGLGHGEGRADLAAQQRRQPAFALRRRGQVQQGVDVGLVGRGAAHRTGAQQAAPGLLEDPRALAPGQAHAAVFRRQLRRYQPAGQRLLAQFAGDTVQAGHVVGQGEVFAGDHHIVDELAHLQAQGIELGRRQGGAAGLVGIKGGHGGRLAFRAWPDAAGARPGRPTGRARCRRKTSRPQPCASWRRATPT